jgi:hypothetical protein
VIQAHSGPARNPTAAAFSAPMPFDVRGHNRDLDWFAIPYALSVVHILCFFKGD